jgi:hypothetical protein
MHNLSVVCLYTATLISTIALGQPETRMNGGALERCRVTRQVMSVPLQDA